MWSYLEHSQVFHIMLDQLKNHLIWLAHSTSKDCPFKVQNWSGSGKTKIVKSEYSLMLIEKKNKCIRTNGELGNGYMSLYWAFQLNVMNISTTYTIYLYLYIYHNLYCMWHPLHFRMKNSIWSISCNSIIISNKKRQEHDIIVTNWSHNSGKSMSNPKAYNL